MFSALIAFWLMVALAFLNGANDVSKGIATLVGGGVTQLRTAVLWGSAWTVAGAFTAAFAAQGLVQAFSGSGIISSVPSGPAFLASVSVGALVWVGFATRTGWPVSTTHAITGALVGAGMVSTSFSSIRWAALAENFLLPLAVSPVLSLVLVFALFPAIDFVFGGLHRYCWCARQGSLTVANGSAAALAAESSVVVGSTRVCEADPETAGFRLNLMDGLHWLSAGATSFARGLNDAPKILALGWVANEILDFGSRTGFLFVAGAMGLGSVMAGWRVTETLANKVTRMSPNEGFAANAITSLLVIAASNLALPVSTTHVSSGAIIGLGLKRDPAGVRWKTVRDFLLAWLVTLPAAAAVGALVCWTVRRFF